MTKGKVGRELEKGEDRPNELERCEEAVTNGEEKGERKERKEEKEPLKTPSDLLVGEEISTITSIARPSDHAPEALPLAIICLTIQTIIP